MKFLSPKTKVKISGAHSLNNNIRNPIIKHLKKKTYVFVIVILGSNIGRPNDILEDHLTDV